MKKRKFPIKSIYQNMVIVEQEKVWSYYKVPAEFVTRIDYIKKADLKSKLQLFLEDMSFIGMLDIRLVPRDMTLEDRLNEVLETMPDYSYDTVREYFNRLNDEIKNEMGQAYVYDWLIGVPLFQLKQNVTNMIKSSFKQTINSVSNLLGYELKNNEDLFSGYESIEEDIYLKLVDIKAQRITEAEMYYITRLNLLRNMPHSYIYEKNNQTIKQVIDGVIDFSKLGEVHLGNYAGESYLAFLPLSETRDEISDIHLAELVQYFSFPVELQYQLFYEEKGGMTGGLSTKLSNAKRRLDNINQEQYEVNGKVSGQKVETSDILEDMEYNLEKDEKFVGWTATVCVYANSREELKKRISTVMSYMNKNGLFFVRGTTEQYDLFMRSFFGQVEKESSYWYQLSTVKSFCENLLFTHNRVGTKTGFYIGRVDTNINSSRNLKQAIQDSTNLVLFNPTIVNKGLDGSKTDSPHIVVTGETGKGKSFLINLLHFYLSFFTKSIYVDVKNEKKQRYLDVINNKSVQEKYPYLVQHIQENFSFVELDANKQEYWGVLDPLIFLTGAESKSLAKSIMYDVYDFKGKDRQERFMKTYVNEVAEMRQNGERVGLMTVVEKLINNDDDKVKECGLLIKETIDGSILRLLFGDENSQSLSFETKNTIIGFQGLSLPNASVPFEQYKEEQKYSVLVMYALGSFSKVFGSNRYEFTVSYIDEAWVYFMTAIGQGILKEMQRIGRSYNNALVLGTQSVKDFGNDENGNFGTIFAFDEPTEREDILKHLRLPVNKLNEKYLENTIKGQCLYLDNYGRCQKITIHCPYPEVVELFKTVDKTDLSELEHKYV